MNFERNAHLLSETAIENINSAKYRLSTFYTQLVQECQDRAQRHHSVLDLVAREKWSVEKKQRHLSHHFQKECEFLRLRRVRLGIQDFEPIQTIGTGAFGQVRLVQKKDTGKIFAMKSLRKADMIKRDQLAHVKAERDILAASSATPWVVQLYYSFQDTAYLYLIMEFLPGGDMMTMLIKYDTFSEDVTRFYMAETIAAVDAIQRMGFVHRDLKPDNLLIDRTGHIKLSDFGLATGFHKTHDSQFYQQFKPTLLLEQDKQQIDLTLSRQERISTWKKNRRQLVFYS